MSVAPSGTPLLEFENRRDLAWRQATVESCLGLNNRKFIFTLITQRTSDKVIILVLGIGTRAKRHLGVLKAIKVKTHRRELGNLGVLKVNLKVKEYRRALGRFWGDTLK